MAKERNLGMKDYVVRFSILLCGICCSCRQVVQPPPEGKEFVFPLKVGNTWEYDWRLKTYRVTNPINSQGTEIWSIISVSKKDSITTYTIAAIIRQQNDTLTAVRYNYVRVSPRLIIVDKYFGSNNDTIPRFSTSYTGTNDTLRIQSQPTIRLTFVNGLGITLIEDISSRVSIITTLKSYTPAP